MLSSTKLCDNKYRGLNGNALKIIGAFFMIIDHIGMLIFPQVIFLRIVGRLAYPIFAFFIAEGCRYTRNKAKYLSLLTLFGIIFQLVYSIATEDYGTVNVICSFSLAVGLIYLWQNLLYCCKNKSILNAIVIVILICVYLYLCYNVCAIIYIDYKFFGIILPFFAYFTKKKYIRLLLFAIGIFLVARFMGDQFNELQYYSLLSVVFIAFYNEKRGTIKMKYFFYIFYPIHIVILYGISLLLGK